VYEIYLWQMSSCCCCRWVTIETKMTDIHQQTSLVYCLLWPRWSVIYWQMEFWVIKANKNDLNKRKWDQWSFIPYRHF
jgi:hypothetical protein